MDGENKGSNPIRMDDLGGFYTPIFGSTPIYTYIYIFTSQTLSRVSPRKMRGVAEKVTFANALGRSAMAVRGLFGVVGGVWGGYSLHREDQAFIGRIKPSSGGDVCDFSKMFGKEIGS